MKKPFKANSRNDRFSYLYANPVYTRRLKIAFPTQSDRDEYRDYLLSDNLGFLKFIGQGWETIAAEEITPSYTSYILDHLKKVRFSSQELIIRRIGSSEILGSIDTYQDSRGKPWMGYHFRKAARGHGYAREAVAGVLDAIQKYEHRTVEMFETFADNEGSKNLLRKLGYQSVGRTSAMAGAHKGKESVRFIR